VHRTLGAAPQRYEFFEGKWWCRQALCHPANIRFKLSVFELRTLPNQTDPLTSRALRSRRALVAPPRGLVDGGRRGPAPAKPEGLTPQRKYLSSAMAAGFDA
jgi:hypothetical protein